MTPRFLQDDNIYGSLARKKAMPSADLVAFLMDLIAKEKFVEKLATSLWPALL